METDPRFSNPNWQRIYQLQLSKGFSPEVASSKANAELAFQTMRDLREAAPAPQLDQFNETPISPEEARRSMPTMTATIPAKPVAQMGKPEDNEEARFNQMRVLNSQARSQGLEEPYPNVPAPRPIDRSAYASSLTNTLTQSLGLPASIQSPPWFSANPPAPAKEQVTEPGFYGATGDILQRAIDATRSSTAASPEKRFPSFEDRQAYNLSQINEAKRFPSAEDRSTYQTQQAQAAARAVQQAKQAAAAKAAPAAPAAAPAQGGNFFSRMFSGPEVQSTGQQVVQRMQGPMAQGQDRPATRLNWGDRDSAADFFRADQARQQLEKSGEAFTGMKRGGSAGGGKDAALHKALEIIHHMLTRGR